MHKNIVIKELEDVIATLKLERRSHLHGISIKICEPDWKRKKECLDSNLFTDWYA